MSEPQPLETTKRSGHEGGFWRRWRLPVGAALAFGLIGPRLGLYILLLELGLMSAIFVDMPAGLRFRGKIDLEKLSIAPDLYMIALPAAYFVGMIPPAVTGFLAGVLLRKGASWRRYLVTCTLVGALISGSAAFAAAGASRSLILAAVPGAVCALLLPALLRFALARLASRPTTVGARP